uniref:Zinc finger protein 235 n=1 Tax=Culex pipiens TaxID=7175 RepID=A0A8D8G5R7_CULPI
MDQPSMVCRVCASGVPEFDDSTVQFSSVSGIYQTLTSLKPITMDLPDVTCQSCYTKLVEFDDFRTVCLEAFEKLLKVAKGKISKVEPLAEDDDKPNLEALQFQLGEADEEEFDQNMLDVKVEMLDEDGQPDGASSIGDDDKEGDSSSSDDESSESYDSEDSLEEKKPRRKRGPYKKRTGTRKYSVSQKKSNEKRDKLQCDKCDKFFYDQKRFEGHQRVHQGLKEAKCDICGKMFSKWYYMHIHHKLEHTGEQREQFACDVPDCGAVFKQKVSLQMHRRKKHETNSEPETPTHICDECGKTCTSASNLRIHKYSHGGNHPIPCTMCDRRFESQSKLKVHMMRHEGIKRYTCSVCGLKKTTVTELKIHMNTHTREKVYPCDVCSAVFSTIGGRSRHIKVVHQGIKAFKCTFCEKSFGKAETLKHHVMTHTGEKPHACDQCDRRFIQLVALQSHKKTHNKGL